MFCIAPLLHPHNLPPALDELEHESREDSLEHIAEDVDENKDGDPRDDQQHKNILDHVESGLPPRGEIS